MILRGVRFHDLTLDLGVQDDGLSSGVDGVDPCFSEDRNMSMVGDSGSLVIQLNMPSAASCPRTFLGERSDSTRVASFDNLMPGNGSVVGYDRGLRGFFGLERLGRS